MANTDNECKDLHVNDVQFPEWDRIFNMQKALQMKIMGNQDFSTYTIKQVVDFFFKNKHALDDELSEMFDALGGIKDGIGPSAWKWWRQDNSIAEDMTLADLSDNDRKELTMEFVDAFHFILNFAVLLNISGSDVVNAYLAKNEENFRRQESGY